MPYCYAKGSYLKKQSFNQEITLSGKGIFKLFKKAKEKKFKIILYYVGLESVKLAKERVKIRVKKGGHNVKDEIIEKRYYTSLVNLKIAIHLCDEVYIYDNSQDFKLIALKTNETFKKLQICKWLENLNLNFS
ncbi:hypothetical protein [Helicobacter burdigaliensis]|uniref:hypothetical protein n=1 Tax=Helicobacter burdigaliensis TaxID=2315334 RepID=UPI000EF6F42C|nr:hypothetical protein [Helicobacter burdigaliensis]